MPEHERLRSFSLQMQRDLLGLQLQELDLFKERHERQVRKDSPPTSPVQSQRLEGRDFADTKFAAPYGFGGFATASSSSLLPQAKIGGSDGLLAAQLKEIVTRVSVARSVMTHDIGRKVFDLPHSLPDLLDSLGKERQYSSEQPAAVLNQKASHWALKLLKLLRGAEARRIVGLVKAKVARENGIRQLKLLSAQLQQIEDEPWRSPGTSQCAVAEVAIVLSDALQERTKLAQELGATQRMRIGVRSLVEVQEQVLAGILLPPGRGEESPVVRIVGYGRVGGATRGGGKRKRLEQLLQENQRLWVDLSNALRESRLVTKQKPHAVDARARQKAAAAAAGNLSENNVASLMQPPDQNKKHGHWLTQFTSRQLFLAWRVAASDLHEWRKGQRFQIRSKVLGRSGLVACSYWFLALNAKILMESPLPVNLRQLKRPRVIDVDGYEGILLSSTSDRLCKVRYPFVDGREPEIHIVPAARLRWVQEVPSRMLAWLSFAMWGLVLEQAKNEYIRRKSLTRPRGVTVAITFGLKGIWLFFLLWKRALAASRTSRRRFLARFVRAWCLDSQKHRRARATEVMQQITGDRRTAEIEIRQLSYTKSKLTHLVKVQVFGDDKRWMSAILGHWRLVVDMKQLLLQAKDSMIKQKGRGHSLGQQAIDTASYFAFRRISVLVKERMFRSWKRCAKAAKKTMVVTKRVKKEDDQYLLMECIRAWSKLSTAFNAIEINSLKDRLDTRRVQVEDFLELNANFLSLTSQCNSRAKELQTLLSSSSSTLRAVAQYKKTLVSLAKQGEAEFIDLQVQVEAAERCKVPAEMAECVAYAVQTRCRERVRFLKDSLTKFADEERTLKELIAVEEAKGRTFCKQTSLARRGDG